MKREQVMQPGNAVTPQQRRDLGMASSKRLPASRYGAQHERPSDGGRKRRRIEYVAAQPVIGSAVGFFDELVKVH